jgi:hypothetical protein
MVILIQRKDSGFSERTKLGIVILSQVSNRNETSQKMTTGMGDVVRHSMEGASLCSLHIIEEVDSGGSEME